MNSLIPIIHQQPLEDTIMEVKESFMLSSPSDTQQPTFRTAHFLKPIANSTHQPTFQFNPSFSTSEFKPTEWPLKIHFNGWRYPKVKWVRWVDELKLKYESVWKKAGIFEAIMSTKSHVMKNQDLVYGVVEKWCCETNTFVLPFGEVTITLEDVVVLGGYSLFGDPVFTLLEDQEMKEVEEKLIVARRQLYKSKQGKPRTSLWMDSFINKSSEIENEAFLATWLAIFVFPNKSNVVKSCLFPIAIRLARGNPIALAPTVLANLYKDLSLFKKKVDDLKTMVKFPLELEVNVQSPFYLVQIWVWERFKNLQPQPKLINNGDHVLLKWHKIKALKIDNVRFALDSAVDDFLWRPYVRFADKCGVFYPNDEFWICKKDLDNEMLSFVICLRVCELVGFESIEQYLPHRVAMQFGMDQDVPSYVPRFNKTKAIAWKNYCRPISDKKLYFPPRFFKADVTTHYAKWWKKSVLGRDDFVKNIVKRKRSASSRKHRAHVGKAKRSSNDVGVPPGFPPHLVDTLVFGKFCDDGSKTKTRKVVELYADVPYENILPLKRPVSKDDIILSIGSLEKDFNDTNGSKEARMSSDRVYLADTQGESCSYAIRNKTSSSNIVTVVQHDLQFHSDKAAQAEAKESDKERERKEKDDEVMVLFKQQCLKNQEELARLTRQQEEILRLMVSREKRDEELRQLLISVLRNQQPPSSSS